MDTSIIAIVPALLAAGFAGGLPVTHDSSPLIEKARFLQKDLIERHLLEGLYVSIAPAARHAPKLVHDVNEPGNVIHAGVWTGRYLAGVRYQYAVTKDPWVRTHGWGILRGLRRLQEVTGKPGLLARGYVKGHGPVEGWERGGADSAEWHQGRGKFANYRWYGDVSVDNFNAVLYGYAVYYDLAADEEQKRFIAHDVQRLMTHLLDNQCRIVDVDGEVTMWGHVGMDPDPSRDEYYRKVYARYLTRSPEMAREWRPPLRSSLMLLPDLLIAEHITGDPKYRALYRRVVDRFGANPDTMRDRRPFSLERLARVNHSSEGQSYEALYNLIRHEKDPKLLETYRGWVAELWEMNWMEGNSLYAFMTAAIAAKGQPFPGTAEGLKRAVRTLELFPVDRVFRPVMNSLRSDIERNPNVDRGGAAQSAKPLPINERPKDNEYEWKGTPYQLDGWLKPGVTAFAVSCDDPGAAWFVDTAGRIWRTLDRGKVWRDVSAGLMGRHIAAVAASPKRTFVLYADTDRGVCVTRDGGLSWREAAAADVPAFQRTDFAQWQGSGSVRMKVGDGVLLRSTDGGATSGRSMEGWRIPLATYAFATPWGWLAGGPGGSYLSPDGVAWTETVLWPEEEVGGADFVHAYWMGRHYGFVK